MQPENNWKPPEFYKIMRCASILMALFLSACLQEIPSNWTPQPITETVPTVFMTNTPTEMPTAALPTSTPFVEFPPASPLPAGPINMIAIGDSLTLGDGDETARGYPGRVLEMVNAVRPGSAITNFGQSGWNSDALIHGDQGLPGQMQRALAEIRAASAQGRGAVVFVWIGSNDLWYLYEYGGDITAEAETLDAQRFSSNLDVILTGLRGEGAQVILALLDDQSLRPVALKGEAFPSINKDELNRMSAQARTYNEIITRKADQYGALTVDFYSTDIFTSPATMADDGNHPNQKGYDLIAQKFFEALSPLLK